MIRHFWSFGREDRTRLIEGSKNNQTFVWLFLLFAREDDYFATLGFLESNKPFFFKVRRAEVETLSLILLPPMIKVFLWTFGLKTLRVLCWEKDTL